MCKTLFFLSPCVENSCEINGFLPRRLIQLLEFSRDCFEIFLMENNKLPTSPLSKEEGLWNDSLKELPSSLPTSGPILFYLLGEDFPMASVIDGNAENHSLHLQQNKNVHLESE